MKYTKSAPKRTCKRTKSLSLLLMGTLALGSAGCGSERAEVDESYTTFTSMEQCVTSGLFNEAECRDLARTALAQTPQFSSQQECESLFGVGSCQSPASMGAVDTQSNSTASRETSVQAQSGSMWMPMMMGFMAGRFMGASGPMQGGQGLYRDASAPKGGQGTQNFRTSQGVSVSSDAKGRVTNPSPALKQSLAHNAKPMTARSSGKSKGGFSGSSKATGGGS